MPFTKLRRNTSSQTTRKANTLKKISSENLTLGDNRTHKIALRIQNMRTAHFETDFKTLIKKLGDGEKIVPHRLDKKNTPKSHRLTHLHHAN
jgi:ribosomal protein L32